ncbi:MAG TPA: NAD(P)H-dependent glycerol-3-phosphate dehydrogenase [Pseudomonadales bacterium]
MPTGVIGLGNMGTALANLIARNGHEVLGWEYDATVVKQINSQHSSPYLPGIALHTHLHATHQLHEVIRHCSPTFITLPSRFIEPTLTPLIQALPSRTIVVNIAKGIHAATGTTTFKRLSLLLPDNPLVHLSGPSIANEYAHDLPTAVMIASHSPEALTAVSQQLDNAYFQTRHSNDPAGIELGGVLKNIYALGLGLLAASGADNVNFKGTYLTTALHEMQTLGVALGAKPESFLGIAGVGDLIATALSEHSHNVRMGRLLASGKPIGIIEQEVGTLPEGYYTLLAAMTLAKQHGIALPLAAGLHAVIEQRMSAAQLIRRVLADQ